MKSDIPLPAQGRAIPPFHGEDMDIRPSAEPPGELVIPELLAAEEVRVYSVAD
jgi:hypothetical protein